MMEPLPVSVIVVVKNGMRTIEDCLKSVRRNNPAEIIIVDGNSTDNTLEIARCYTDRIYSDEGKGVSFAHQLGAEKATQQYIAYVDADIILPNYALSTMLDELQVGNYANVQAQLNPTSLSTYLERAADAHTKMILSRVVSGLSAAVLDKDAILKIGFDPSIHIAGDDFDFLNRLKNAGYKTCLSSVSATHVHRANLKSFLKQRFWYGRSRPALIIKWGLGKPELWIPLATFYRLIYCLVKGKLHLLPYFFLDGMIQTAGMVKGFFETMFESRKAGLN